MSFDYYMILLYVIGFVGMFTHSFNTMPNIKGEATVVKYVSNGIAALFLAAIWPFLIGWQLCRIIMPR